MTRNTFIEAVSELDGRSDQRIKSYYIETRALERIRKSTVPAVAMVGLKGAGKTTLFRLLTEDWSDEPNIIRIGLAPDRSAFEQHVDRINCLQFAKSVRQGMLILLADLIDESRGNLSGVQRAATETWAARKAALFSDGGIVDNLKKRLGGLSILGCGLDDAANRREGPLDTRSLSSAEATALEILLADFSAYNLKIRIVVDDPDRLFTNEGRPDENLLAGYILGTNEIAKSLGYVQFVHILKSNVYQSLFGVEEMANLPSDYFDYISWNSAELISLIEARLSYAALNVDDVFEAPLSEIVDALATEIRNGPRDVLRYIEIILKSGDSAKVSLATMRASKAKFKRAARQQMEAVYGSIYEGIEPLLASIFESSAELSFGEFRTRFMALRMSSQPASVNYADPWLKGADRAFRALIEAGAVDVHTEEGWKRPYEAGYFLFDVAAEAKVRRAAIFN